MGMNTLRNNRWSQHAQRFRRLSYARPVVHAQQAPPPADGVPAGQPVTAGTGTHGAGTHGADTPGAGAHDQAGQGGVAVKTGSAVRTNPDLRAHGPSVPAPRSAGHQGTAPPRLPRPVVRGPQAATYWRRRLVALLTGLTVLALITWAFSGAMGGGNGNSAGPAGKSGSGQQAGGSGGSGHGATAGHAAGAGAGTSTQGDTSTHGRHGNRAPYGHPRPCPAGSVVLSLFASQVGYGAGELPQFNVDVVATGRQTCSFNVGARHVALTIRAGSVRVWSSADCVQGAGNLVSDLQRGVPTVLPISWNRQASAPGCPSGTSRMPAGKYTATVSDGALTSNPVSFRIS
jgi:hypothetical protein